MDWLVVSGDPKTGPHSQEPHRSEQVAFLLKEEPVKPLQVATIPTRKQQFTSYQITMKSYEINA